MPLLKPGPHLDKGKPKEFFRIILFVLILTCLVSGGVLLYRHFNPVKTNPSNPTTAKSKPKLATAADEQARYQQAINNNLKSGNILSYENSELELANRYITANNYTAADQITQTVQKNVPKDKLNTYYYQIKIQIDQHNKDIVSQKSDLQTLITKLKATSQTAEAAIYQKQLDKL